jgi:hypothetical protein
VNGFIKIRRGLEEHLVSGQLGFFEVGVYLTILLQANYETGVWVGSAPRLCRIGFLKVMHVRGKKGNFPALINRYEPQFGALRGMRLNAEASTSWQQPVYESCAEGALTPRSERAEAVAEDGTEPAPYPEVEKTKKKDKSSPDLDDLKKSFLSKCEDPHGMIAAMIEIVCARAERSGTVIKTEAYLAKALDSFDTQAGQDREELLQFMNARAVPL